MRTTARGIGSSARRLGVATAGLVVLALAACSTSLTDSDCDRQDLAITVTSGTTPQFSWQPDCPVSRLRVSLAWVVESPLENSIRSPVRYGTLPAGVIEDDPPIALQAGVAYTVNLERRARLSDGGSYLRLAGSQTFTP